MGDAFGGSVAAHDGNAIAVIGLACRFPLAPSPAAFWRLLCAGTDAVTDAPADRRAYNDLYDPASLDGEAVSHRGGFLDRVDAFDADFFGISPREAEAMDPQQRLMLELVWEAFEDGRTAPGAFRGTATGVFFGVMADDYASLVHERGLESVTSHTMTGLQRSFVANRVSYALGLRGPSLIVDTGQSSSLVAVHLACESLRRGECSVAVAGGVHLNIAAHATMEAVRLGVLSPEGFCATFDEGAEGIVRGEGGGAVVLKPLSQALADGDRVYCVVRGSAVGSDGDTPSSLTAPGEPAQREVLRAAYRRAGVDPSAVQYVELHGTGTKVGDPIEASALGTVCGAGRPAETPLLVGSVKTNIGHLEGAAGIAGLIKTALSIAHQEIPPNLHFRAPNPDIPLEEYRIRVQRELTPWPGPYAVAGVSSFGMGGTNCHVVLAAPPALADLPAAGSAGLRTADPAAAPVGRPADRAAGETAAGPLPWVVSGRTDEALRAQAARLLEHADGIDLRDGGFSLATTRTAFEHRAAVVAADRPALLAGLRALAEGGRAANVVRGTVTDGRLAFLFPGQGFQRVGMGRRLHDAFPAFAEAFDAVCAELDAYLERPLREVVWAEEGTDTAALLDQTCYTQPALFAIEVALYRLMESFGLRPDLVAGHSVGEFAAAHAAGVLTLADAAKLVAARGRLMQALPPGGAMIAVQASLDEVAPLLAGHEDQVGLAAVNGPAAIVISGDEETAERIAAQVAEKGRKTKRLKVSHAFHSPLMEPMLAELRNVAASLGPGAPNGIAFVSTVTGRPVTADELREPGYWAEHARRPVLFADAAVVLRERGARLCLEIGPGNGLTGMGKVALAGQDVSFLASMRGRDEVEAVVTAVAGLHVRGVEVGWHAVFGPRARRVDLPTYAFQRRSYWLRSGASLPANGSRPDKTALPERPEIPAPVEPQTPAPSAGDLRALVTETVGAVLGHDEPGRIDHTRTFKDLGFDSGMTVELAARLSEATGQDLQPSLVYSCPTPAALIEHLGPMLDADPAPERTTSQTSQTSSTKPADPDEALAIVGMSCRYPGGVRSPEDLWALVENGEDAIAEFPANRGWDLDALYDPEPGRAGRTYTRLGGFLYDADEFDAAFFGISPREATAMDPQQRILLETCWEALERAGLAPDGLRGEPVGVFVGASAQDYGPRLHEPADGYEGHLLTGNTTSVASGRVAYVLGLRGPAVTVDTACSSSLVALHLAGQALRNGDCRIALACGVTVMSSPGMFVNFSMQRGLAPDGRCKPFAAAADGTGWAEGAGVVVLERLSDARRLGHPVLALVRGSATNQDGASNGLSAPNGRSQELVIRRALATAGLGARDVAAVEAHGTGTALGDPIEAAALIATYGEDRPEGRPLLVGSLKSNIGHAQAAAGIAGVIKMVGAIRRGTLARTLHIDRPSPHVDWSGGQVALLTETTPWPGGGDGPRRAAVSSFGISGTNAHVILEQAPEEEEPPGAPGAQGAPQGAVPWILSAASPAALRAQAEELRATLDVHPEYTAGDVGHSLATTRAHLRHRAAVVAADAAGLRTALAALAAGEPGAVQGTAGTGTTAFVFPGQGSQWQGMALDLLESSKVFRDRMTDCTDALAPYTDWSLPAVLRGEPGEPPLSRVDVVQPTLFSIMVSLAAVWRSVGVTPSAVAGHSQGEIAAACVAGALSLDDAAKVVALRSRALGELAGTGAMASIPLPEDEVRRRLAERGDGLVEIAAINGAQSTTVAGAPEAVAGFVADCVAQDINARLVDVDYASHTSHVEVLRDTLVETLAGITPRRSDIPFFSTISGEPIDTTRLGAEYWYENLRSTVRFEAATRALLREGHQTLIEVSPHPILCVPITQTIEEARETGTAVGTLRRDGRDREEFLGAVARAWVAGAPVGWESILPRGRRVPLPTYAFQRQRFWLEAPSAGATVTVAGLEDATHPMLGAMTELPGDGGLLFTGRVSLAAQPWLTGHRVSGTVIVSATTLLDLAIHAGEQAGCPQVEELTMQAPLVVPERGSVQLRVMVEPPDDAGGRPVAIYSRPEEPAGRPWVRHAAGTLGSDRTSPAEPETSWPPADAVPVDLDDAYPALAERGYGYGPGFQGLSAAWRRGDEVFAEVALPGTDADAEAAAAAFTLHPVLLDSALHALLHVRGFGGDGIPLPWAWTGVTVPTAGARRLRVRLSPDGAESVSMTATAPTGELVAAVRSLTFRPVARDALAAPGTALLTLEWTGRQGRRGVSRPPRCAVLGSGDPLGVLPGARYADLDALARALEKSARRTPDLVFAYEPPPDHDGGVPEAVHVSARRTLELVQAWLADERFGSSRLVVVTHRAVSGDEDVDAVVQAPVWGLVRSAQSENPDRFVLADVAADDVDSWRALPAAAASGEPQLLVRGGDVLVPRLRNRVAADGLLRPPADTPAWILDTGGAGTIDDLALLPAPQATAPLGTGQVRVSVRAGGLNFRDVTVALGLLPSEKSIGIEGAGVVTEVGPGVPGLAPGDRVMGLFDGAFGPVAVADHEALAPIPRGWSYAEAAAVPVAYVTAYQCLVDVARLRAGESVVVHAATGGVGFAALWLARHLGAEVFATASPAKWDALRAMGLDDDHIASSRSLEFADQFRTVTKGRGVDVVLNALAGEFTDASLELLAPGGRFVEMGKTDPRDPERVAADHPGVTYHRYNLRDETAAGAGRSLARVLDLFDRGALRHPPLTIFDVRRGREAFTLMSRAGHKGKIVLTVPRSLDPDGTVLITGGTGTLGGLLARHFVTTYGVRRLVLAGRRGASAEGAAELAAELAALGAEVDLAACDVTDRESLRRVIDGVPADRPLTAVVHAAGTLDDAIVPSLTPERLAKVLRPKADGAWHLHELTGHLDLAAFVLFSSVLGVLGEPGQANYAAANTVLDTLARHRRARGLPATSLGWGFWAQRSGMTGHMAEADLARLRRNGIDALATEDALRLFDTALGAEEPVLVPVTLDTDALAARDEVPVVLRGLVEPAAGRVRPVRKVRATVERNGGAARREQGGDGPSLVERLTSMTEAERDEALLKLVCAEAATVLGQAAETLAPDTTFRELGVDSLTGLELRNRLNNSTGLRLRASLTTDNPTPSLLARFLGGELSALSTRDKERGMSDSSVS